jgi:hypothetical protein
VDRLKAHRPDGLANLRGISTLTWSAIGGVLASLATSAQRASDREVAKRAVDWLATKTIAATFT